MQYREKEKNNTRKPGNNSGKYCRKSPRGHWWEPAVPRNGVEIWMASWHLAQFSFSSVKYRRGDMVKWNLFACKHCGKRDQRIQIRKERNS